MSERDRRAEEIARAAREIPEADRQGWIESECGDDASLLRAVERVVDATAPTLELDKNEAGPQETLSRGTLLAHYRLVERLGAGGMGDVWLARDEKLGRQVALKFPSRALMSDPATRRRLQREARAAAAIDHPAVCRVFELSQADARDFIAMEYVPGETVAAKLARGPVPVAQALSWGATLAAALEEAHDKGIVHRDLKPSNVMVTPSGQLKVMDFGLAAAVPSRGEPSGGVMADSVELTAAGVVLGTPGYIAPELLGGSPATAQSDIWALACILYQMLTGANPFRGATVPALFASILERDPDFSLLPPDTPVEVRVLIARCLRKDPMRRLRHAGDLRLALEEAQDGLRASRPDGAGQSPAVPDRDAHPSAPSGGAMSRRHLILGAGAVGLFAAGAGAGALAGGGTTEASVSSFQRLTFRRGMVRNARFAPDQRTILYGALWDGDPCRTYSVRPESPESRALDLPASTPLSISRNGDIALLLGEHLRGLWPRGTLARVPLAGGAPRELVEDVTFADWAPDGTDLAIVREKQGKTILEFPIGTPVYESTGWALSFPRVSPAGDSIAMFDHHARGFGGTVVVIDRRGKVAYRSDEFLELFGLAWRGDEVWFTGGDERRVFRAIHAVRPPGVPRVVARIPGNVTLHDIAADGQLIIAHTTDRGEIAASLPGASAERNLSWLDASIIADLSRDGRTILFTEYGQGGGAGNSTYIRGTDGSPAIRLGEGRAMALSPDGMWAAAAGTSTPSPYLDLIPTAAGDSRRIELPGMRFSRVRWMPGGQRLMIGGDYGVHESGVYLVPLDGDPPRPISPPGMRVTSWALHPEGRAVALMPEDGDAIEISLDGDGSRAIRGVQQGDVLRGWIATGILVSEPGHTDVILLVDPETGARQVWWEFAPADAAGIMDSDLLMVTPDGNTRAYWWHRALSDLYLAGGLQA